MQNLIRESQRILSERVDNRFTRISNSAIDNELFTAQKALAAMYKQLDRGEDFDAAAFDAIMKKLETVRKSAQKFSPEHDTVPPSHVRR